MADNSLISKYWTPQEFELAHEMACAGNTAREIAAILGRTKNSVIGVLHRSGFVWGTRGKPAVRKVKEAPDRKKARVRGPLGRFTRRKDELPVAPTFVPAEQPQNEGVIFLDLRTEHCRAIYGDPNGAQTIYCGAQKTPQSPYCLHHQLKYYRKAA